MITNINKDVLFNIVMSEYLFMYFIAFAAVLFAVIQDLRTREISNWVTFSLIGFVLAYRAIYSVYLADLWFFLYGLIGVLLFVVLGYLFYYSRVFAGGDAKLLFGIGGVFPYSSLTDYIYYGLGFILVLFTFGVIYTLIYSFFLVGKNYNSFKKEFSNHLFRIRFYFILSVAVALAYFFLTLPVSVIYLIFAFFIAILPFLFAYVKAIEKTCMIKFVATDKITEGDWLEKDVSIGKRIIKKSFAGLTLEEIALLRKHEKRVWIKNGIPFAPAFLIALIFFILILRYSSW